MTIYYPTFILSILLFTFLTYQLIKGLFKGKLLVPLDVVGEHFATKKQKIFFSVVILMYLILYFAAIWFLLKSL